MVGGACPYQATGQQKTLTSQSAKTSPEHEHQLEVCTAQAYGQHKLAAGDLGTIGLWHHLADVKGNSESADTGKHFAWGRGTSKLILKCVSNEVRRTSEVQVGWKVSPCPLDGSKDG